MSWFGGRGSKKEESPKQAVESPSDLASAGNSFDSGFDDDSLPPITAPAMGEVRGDQEALQRALAAEQQRIMVQAVMFRLTDMSFEQCVPNPGTTLSSTERNCIAAMTNKYIEASELIKGRMKR